MRPQFSRPTPVADSGFIQSMRYAANTRTLELTIRGTRYRYYGVGRVKAARIASERSVGAYYNAQIRGKHPRRKFAAAAAPLPEMTAAANAHNRTFIAVPSKVNHVAPLSASWGFGEGLYQMQTAGPTLLEIYDPKDPDQDYVVTTADFWGYY